MQIQKNDTKTHFSATLNASMNTKQAQNAYKG
jgi:hypothetical protein